VGGEDAYWTSLDTETISPTRKRVRGRGIWTVENQKTGVKVQRKTHEPGGASKNGGSAEGWTTKGCPKQKWSGLIAATILGAVRDARGVWAHTLKKRSPRKVEKNESSSCVLTYESRKF